MEFDVCNMLIALSKIFPMKPSKTKNFFSVKSYDEKPAQNYRKLLRCRKANNFQTIKYIDAKFDYHKLKT